MFDSYQKIRLRDLAWRCNEEKPDYSQPNPLLDAYIAELQVTHPELFHDKASLPKRVFMDQPLRAVPYGRALRSVENSTLSMIRNTQ